MEHEDTTDSDDDSVISSLEDSSTHASSVDLGTYSPIHLPINAKLREKIINMQYVDLSSLIYSKSVAETKTIQKSHVGTVTSVQTEQLNLKHNVMVQSISDLC